ncbi:hypothetical protein GCM10022216_22870 [Sphingobacterium kyonggiense]|uniref:Uncharacterized protein n=1 Tax=Sphingobacterium kyonggiense TaxID=714075 RepID=A0ABP7YVY4_9SPHI
MILHHFFISLNETVHAASNNKGGKTKKKITSGSIRITGKPGIKLINKPAKTNNIGYAILSFLAQIVNKTINKIKTKIIGNK